MLEYASKLNMIAIYELDEQKMKLLIEDHDENCIILMYDHRQQYKGNFHNRLFQKLHPKLEDLTFFSLNSLFSSHRFTL